jgi:hypothetical protein
MKKKIIITATIIVISGGAFFGGIKYAESKSVSKQIQRNNFQNFRNMSPEERQQMAQNSGSNPGAMPNNRANTSQRNGGGSTTGEIISIDDKSLTVKLQDGGSKIIFISNSTEITKTATGTISDLEIGNNVMTNGTTNSDGSITAQTIQLKPNYKKQ